MKISFNPSQYNIQTKMVDVKKQTATNPNQNQIEIQKNSIAEILGRTQTISFGATNKTQGAIFEHTCKEKFGLGEKDVIKYNKQNGSLKHEIFANDGSLKESHEFFPQDASEIHTKIDDYGRKTITTTTPEYRQTEKFDSKGRQVLLDYQDVNGKRYRADIDYSRQRKVIRENNTALLPEKITVIDLKTQQPVTSGALVIDTRYDKNTNSNITENILTKQILKVEHLRQNGNPERIVEYVEGSGLIAKETSIDAKTGEQIETTYTGYGTNNVVSVIKTSKDGRQKQVIKYEEDGRTVKSNVLYAVLKNGQPDYKVVYRGGSDVINYEEEYFEDTYTRTFYTTSPNVPNKEECYTNKGNELICETYYYDDGKTRHIVKEYEEDGSARETIYTTREKAKEARNYSPTGFLRSVEKFDQRTGRIVQATDYNERTGFSQDTFYDINSQEVTRTILYDRQGKITEDTEYYQDGQTPKHNIKYNFDGSYTETFYWEDGGVRSSQEYDQYGRKKQPNYNSGYRHQYQNQYQNSYQHTTNATNATGSSNAKVESETEFLSRIGSIAANKDMNVLLDFKTSDWERLTKILGIDKVETVKYMDQKTYRQLAMQYHPDRCRGDESMQKKNIQLFQIINEIHKVNK